MICVQPATAWLGSWLPHCAATAFSPAVCAQAGDTASIAIDAQRIRRTSRSPRENSGARRDAFFDEHVLELAVFVHLADDVAAADELALDVELRNRRPVGEFLDALTDRRIGEHVDTFELDAQLREDLHDAGGEAALWENRRALHEEHDTVVGDILLDAVGNGGVGGHRILVLKRVIPRGRWFAAPARATRCPCGLAARHRPSGAAARASCL